MAHLKEVRDHGAGRSHWVAEGPAGVAASWDATLTRFVPYELLAWRSEPGSVVANAGVIRFEPTDDGGTRVDIRLSYNPPAGALGHFAALLFGDDPKSAMDEDLVRLKSLLEQGKATDDRVRDPHVVQAARDLTQGVEDRALLFEMMTSFAQGPPRIARELLFVG